MSYSCKLIKLNLGCNVGHITLQIAKKFEPKKVVGIDIDVQLIYAARKNIRYYVDKMENEKNNYPISCEIVYGSLMTQSSSLFPKNVYFIQVKNINLLSMLKGNKFLTLSFIKFIVCTTLK